METLQDAFRASPPPSGNQAATKFAMQNAKLDRTLEKQEFSIRTLRAEPELNIGRHVTVCGKLELLSPNGSEREVSTVVGDETYAVRLEPDLRGRRSGDRTCFTGLFERVDGLSRREADQQGKLGGVITDNAAHPAYWLREDRGSKWTPEPVLVSIKALRTRPDLYLGKYVRICGKMEPPLPDGQREASQTEGGWMYAVILAPTILPSTTRTDTCYLGIFEHREGLSFKEAVRQGKTGDVADSASHPWYWLRHKNAPQPRR